MSCPNPDLLSAFFDGEVESPWFEKIREHIDTCPSCGQALARLESLKRTLLEDPEPPASESLQRTRQRLQRSLFGKPLSDKALSDKALSASRLKKHPIWRSRVTLPVPAIAAMLLVFLGMGGLLIFLSTRPNFPFMSIKTQPSGITEVQVAAPIEDLEQLLRSLDQESGNQQIVITLPADTEFLQFGEPEMVRAEEYSRRLR
jgi:hypothetical protein